MSLTVGHIEIAKLLLDKGADVNGYDAKKTNILRRTIQFKKVEIAKLLLDHGANINSVDSLGGISPVARFFKKSIQ